jgi:hypothetical protein
LHTLFVAALLLQPLHGAEIGETAWTASAETGDPTCSVAAGCAEDRPDYRADATCATCSPEMNRGCRSYFFADSLFWTVREGAAENWAQIITPQQLLWTNISTTTLVDAPFDWRAGLRVGTGVQRNDGVDMTLYYTYFHTSAASQAAGEVYSAFMGNFYIDNTDGSDYGPHYHQASIGWDFDFHTIDFEIGRNYAIGTNLELRPFLGLKTAIINQSIKSNWRDPIDTISTAGPHVYTFTSATEDLNLGFWGIGPSLGSTMTMPLCRRDRYSLKLFGTPSGAIMFGHWTFTEQYNNYDAHGAKQSTITIDMSPITGAATMLRGVVGLEWEQYFSRATSTVRVGYEAQLWLNQMQFYSYNIGRLNNVTSLQGGFLEWQLTF